MGVAGPGARMVPLECSDALTGTRTQIVARVGHELARSRKVPGQPGAVYRT